MTATRTLHVNLLGVNGPTFLRGNRLQGGTRDNARLTGSDTLSTSYPRRVVLFFETFPLLLRVALDLPRPAPVASRARGSHVLPTLERRFGHAETMLFIANTILGRTCKETG